MTGPETPDPRVEDGFLEREDLDEATVRAVGKLSEALETVEVARGHLYQFHRLSGTADFQVGEAVELMREAGHPDLAADIERELVGRNVLEGRWTFQVVEEYDAGYYSTIRRFDEQAVGLVHDWPHLYEAGLKRNRRTPGEPGHRASPGDEE